MLAAPSVRAQTLSDLHRAALARDPAVAAAQAQWRGAQERVFQARAAFGPVAAFSANHSYTRYREAPDLNLRPFRSGQMALQVTQPLLQLGLFPALDIALLQQDQAGATLQQAQADAGQRVVEAVFDLLKARDALQLAQAQRVAVDEQLRSAQRGQRVGTAPMTDVREAEARADAVTAQLASAEVELDLRRQVLAELSGLEAPTLTTLALADERLPELPGASLPAWLLQAQDLSPQVRQARQALETAEAEVRKAWHGHAPSAELTLSHAISADTGTVTSVLPRRGDSTTVGVNVNIPLFAGGATQSKVVEAMAQRDKARSELEGVRRNVNLAVRQAFAAALAATSQARSLDTALRSQDVVLRAQRRAYEVGLKVNSEVLDAQSRLFEVRRDLARARYEAWVAHSKLKSLAGPLAEADLAQLDALLVPQSQASLLVPVRPAEEGRRP